jgi:hypothetical protein
MPRRDIDVPLLFKLWSDHAISRVEIAHRLGVATSTLGRLQATYKLPTRPVDPKRRMPQPDPTKEEMLERMAECRARDLARKLKETPDETRKRVWIEDKQK